MMAAAGHAAFSRFDCQTRVFKEQQPHPSPFRLHTTAPFAATLSLRSRRFSLCRLISSCASSDETAVGPSSNNGSPSASKGRRDMLLEYVKTVQPEFMDLFVKRAPEQVVEAMRQTVTNMLGTLPPQFFAVTVSTVAENLAQLMYSVMMTGYMFRNAQFRLDLQQSIAALPGATSLKLDPEYAPGVQKKVSGEIIRWHNETGPEAMDAAQYVELLENEITELQQQLEKSKKLANGGNELLNYLKTLEPQNLQVLKRMAMRGEKFGKAKMHEQRPSSDADEKVQPPIRERDIRSSNVLPLDGKGADFKRWRRCLGGHECIYPAFGWNI